MTQTATETPEAVLSIEVVCDKCGRKRSDISNPSGQTLPSGERRDTVSLFFEMDSKVGAEPADPTHAKYKPFFRCAKCWLDYDGFDGPQARSQSRVIEPAPVAIAAVVAPVDLSQPKKKRGKRAQPS